MELTDELKEAIKEMPEKKKDTLLLRLVKKDHKLVSKLYSELLDDRSLDERRDEMEERVIARSVHMVERFYSPGYLMMDMRDLSGEITEHVRLTKDKYGEVYLNLLMLNTVLREAGPLLDNAPRAKTHKMCAYVIARTFRIMVLLTKLHEDFWLELEEDFVTLGGNIATSEVLVKASIYHGLDLNWLMRFDIPEDIEQIQKELRANGYLK